MSEFEKPCADYICSATSVQECIECVKTGQAACCIWPVIKDMLNRLEALEGK